MPPSRGVVLIVDDDATTAELIAELVEDEGFRAIRAGGGREAVEAFIENHPVAVFLDWVLPDIPGTEACRLLRQKDRLVPILFLSGRDDEASAVRGLDAGADDYLTKPVRIRELIARLEAQIRKVETAREELAPREVEVPADARARRFGDIEIDLAARRVRVAGQDLSLAPLEFSLLEYLARNPGVAVSREQIMREVYGFPGEVSTERVDQLVRRLRQKLGDGPDRAGVLVAVPGYGYRLEPTTAESRT
jgi:DNA-binding response OmpR family regulator